MFSASVGDSLRGEIREAKPLLAGTVFGASLQAPHCRSGSVNRIDRRTFLNPAPVSQPDAFLRT